LAVWGPVALGLGAVLQQIGSKGSVCFGLRSGLTTNSQFRGPVPLGLGAVLQQIGSIGSGCLGIRGGLTTN